jgi:hypothetical protein
MPKLSWPQSGLATSETQRLDAMLEASFEKADLAAWCKNMDDSIRDITQQLTAQRVILFSKLTLPIVINGVAEFPFASADASVASLRKGKIPLESTVLVNDALSTVALVHSLYDAMTTTSVTWPVAYVKSIEESPTTHAKPDLVALRRNRACTAFTALPKLKELCDIFDQHARWLDELLMSVFAFRGFARDYAICVAVTKNNIAKANARKAPDTASPAAGRQKNGGVGETAP